MRNDQLTTIICAPRGHDGTLTLPDFGTFTAGEIYDVTGDTARILLATNQFRRVPRGKPPSRPPATT